MQEYDFDLFTIGGGSGGVRASRMAAGFGAKVAIAEASTWGGTCVHRGCIPKKLFTYAAHVPRDLEVARSFGWTFPEGTFDWNTLIANKDAELERLGKVYENLLRNAGCTLITGRARFVDPHTVEVEGRTYTAKNILIATGGEPVKPEGPAAHLVSTSDDAFRYDALPGRIVVIGGGYIACEFAGVFAGLGAEVHLVHRGDLPLRGFDDDIRRHILEEMPRHGITPHMGCTVQRIRGVSDTKGGKLTAQLSDGSELRADEVLCCIGRRPLTQGLGLEAAGLSTDEDGAIPVDDEHRTRVPNIFAVGDVTGRVQLTPVALAEGMAVAYHLFGPHERPLRYDTIPTAVFSAPAVATVGLTETRAIQCGHEVDIYMSRFRPLKVTLSDLETRVLVKLVVDAKTQKVLGVHMVGDDAPEVIQGFAVALRCGATKDDFDATIGIHPTSAEELVTLRTPTRRAAPK